MRSTLTAVASGVFLLAFASVSGGAPALPAGTIAHGTLTNDKLRADAMLGLRQAAPSRGCPAITEVDPYVVANPAGSPGSRAWRERWVLSCGGKFVPIEMGFKESGSGAVDWAIY